MHSSMGRGVVATAAALLAIVFAVTGLVSGHQDASAASGPVSITGLAFAPATMNINVGDTVTWTNNEATAIQHTVTSDSGTDLNSALLSPGMSYAHTFTIAGTYAYHCNVHSFMHGTVVVAAANTTTATASATTAAPTTAVPTTTTAVPTTAAPRTATGTAVASATAAAPATGSGAASSTGSRAPLFFGLAGVAGAVSLVAGSAAIAVRRRR